MSKKDHIISLYQSGITDVTELAALTRARPSYVAAVLQQSGFLSDYHDLYTGTDSNVYARYFKGLVGFKDVPTAERSVGLMERMYVEFGKLRDRAGQHHALSVALTMLDRARWSGKSAEADIFRQWLVDKLEPREAGLSA